MFVQIVKFRLRPDAPRKSFVDLAQQMIAWLESRPGFIAYELYEGSGCWSDRIAWKDQACAETGLREFLATEIAKQITPLVADGSSSFFGEAVACAWRGHGE